VRENIDILHAIVNKAIGCRDKEEVGKDVWTQDLPPEATIHARTIPLLEAECTRLCTICKGTSVRFLTSPILSHSPPVHMYSLSSPLYHFQDSTYS
jgi:hypothetical protein